MANNAQSSQNKSDNLGRARVAYAFKISRVNPDFVSFKIWILGYYSKVCSIAVSSLPKIVAQIDTALADGECEFELGGIRFSADETVLKSIRKEFSSYCCNEGASDANHVRVNPPRVAASESVKKCGAKQKASAPQGSASAARQISIEERAHPRFPRSYVRRNSKIAKIAAESIGSALRAELEPVLDALDDIGAMLSELLAERGIDRAPKQPLGWRKCTVENPLGAAIRTKCGRTSVVVGVRKVAKFQPKTKGKSK